MFLNPLNSCKLYPILAVRNYLIFVSCLQQIICLSNVFLIIIYEYYSISILNLIIPILNDINVAILDDISNYIFKLKKIKV